eukprot:CAMPEP_0198342408 /NCGR_PEP_ID=MMETSP1450-20131203/51051_1 /TAXON_ID=753684 ORGANISM="Madagascaria erythrocladiodes, Strain CCMP3234" /NCGR_SAMPLE_ID=MMETSP1450 /ASSEMBLY_ACC=CAM_ASM_001115 /LENGTH=510 /DNA_ID=CAMNT_0044047495 /DNA_START=30 /DNA_END=1562 /DNA_ORIENTATION=-
MHVPPRRPSGVWCATAALIVAAAAVAVADDNELYVSPHGSDAGPGTNPTNAFANIYQAARKVTTGRRTIVLMPGVYSGTGNTGITLPYNVTVKSIVSGRIVPEPRATRIDGRGASTPWTFSTTSQRSYTSSVIGVQFFNFSSAVAQMGPNAAGLTFRNCLFSEVQRAFHTTGYPAGAQYVTFSETTFEHVRGKRYEYGSGDALIRLHASTSSSAQQYRLLVERSVFNHIDKPVSVATTSTKQAKGTQFVRFANVTAANLVTGVDVSYWARASVTIDDSALRGDDDGGGGGRYGVHVGCGYNTKLVVRNSSITHFGTAAVATYTASGSYCEFELTDSQLAYSRTGLLAQHTSNQLDLTMTRCDIAHNAAVGVNVSMPAEVKMASTRVHHNAIGAVFTTAGKELKVNVADTLLDANGGDAVEAGAAAYFGAHTINNLYNVTVHNNKSNGKGALYFGASSTSTIYACTLTRNKAPRVDGGASAAYCEPSATFYGIDINASYNSKPASTCAGVA